MYWHRYLNAKQYGFHSINLKQKKVISMSGQIQPQHPGNNYAIQHIESINVLIDCSPEGGNPFPLVMSVVKVPKCWLNTGNLIHVHDPYHLMPIIQKGLFADIDPEIFIIEYTPSLIKVLSELKLTEQQQIVMDTIHNILFDNAEDFDTWSRYILAVYLLCQIHDCAYVWMP